MSTVQDFSGVEFDLAIGEVYGLRTWRMDEHGRLRALHLHEVPAWRPGVNMAACHRGKTFPGGFLTGGIISPSWFAAAFAPPTPKGAAPESEPEDEHLVPDEQCRCGFYAYTDPRHEETDLNGPPALVLGVIRGTGRTLIGTKGFRCEHAEIVGLLDPTRGGLWLTKKRWLQRRALRRVYPEVPLLATRRDLLHFAPLTPTRPAPSTDEFWELP